MVAARRIRFSWARARRTAWRGLLAVALVLVLLVLLTALSFLLPQTRNLWLGGGMDLAVRSLPGELAGNWSWPELNRFEGRSLVWTVPNAGADPDTLAVIEELTVAFDLQALRRAHDLRLMVVRARSSLLNVPAIMSHLPADSVTSTDNEAATGLPWLRPGPLPQVPSIALESFDLQLGDLILPDGRRARNLSLAGSATALAGSRPGLVLESSGGQASSSAAPEWSAELAALRLSGTYDPALRIASLDTLSALLPRFEIQADTLAILAGPLDLKAAGSWQDGRLELASHLDFSAAVPVQLKTPWPGVEIQDFSGRLDLEVRGDARTAEVTASLELDPTADVRNGRLEGDLQIGLQPELKLLAVMVDTLSLSWRGTQLSAQASWDGQTVDGRARADLPDLQLPQLLAPGRLPGMTGKIRLDTRFRGPQADPEIQAQVFASGGIASVWDLPESVALAGNLPADFPRDDFRQVNLDLRGVLSGHVNDLDVGLRLDLGRSPWLDRGLVAGRTRLNLKAGTLGTLQLDTLTVALRQAEFFASGLADTAGADLAITMAIDDPAILQLLAPEAAAGTDLAIKAHGRINGPWTDLNLNASASGRVDHPEFSASDLSLQVDGSAGSHLALLRAAGGVRLGAMNVDLLEADWKGGWDPAARVPVGDFRLEIQAPQARGWAVGSAGGDSVRTVTLDSLGFVAAGQMIASTEPTVILMGPGPQDLEITALRLKGDLGNLSLAGRTRDGELALSADTHLILGQEWLDTLFPAPFWSASGGLDLTLDGHLDLDAPRGDDPDFSGRASLALVPRNNDPPARLESEFRTDRGDTTGLVADLALSIGSTPLVKGSALWPGTIDPATGAWRLAEGGSSGSLTIKEQELPLVFINRFLPAEITLEGQLTIGANLEIAQADSVAADVTQGSVTGLIKTQGLRVNLPNRSRVDLDSEVRLAGRLIDPRLEGTVLVTSGLFRLPEIQRALLPVSGSSVLWEAAAADSAALVETWGADRETLAEPALYLPDLDLQVNIPGNFRVIGYGLESELTGGFKVTRGWDEKGHPVPVLKGRILVVEGTLRAMNHIFEVERGEFDLEGRIPPDPTVNLVMMTDIDGTIVRIRVTGTSLQPEIVLESEPEMVQADIMAFILFGRPFNDLDTDQRGSLRQEQTPAQQLRQNLQELALVFGATGMQNRVSGKIGVDQVQIGSDTLGGSALLLGKFLNPRLLLKYQQSLERSGTYFMTLQYTLNRYFKLITTYGQGEEVSGLELRWQRRY